MALRCLFDVAGTARFVIRLSKCCCSFNTASCIALVSAEFPGSSLTGKANCPPIGLKHGLPLIGGVMGKAGCMRLGVFLLATWGCCRATTGCMWSEKVIARVSSCKGQLAVIDLLVVPVFEASGGWVDAATLITAWSALIAVSNGCCHSP